ncbi:HAD-IIB family hydrolase [Rubripirellula reticaptiva]|uniref:Putative mannosyl-3-phosphoglycerate phosphatase n=1 Tax=Rubripirellula reticaptiva TaxID=2528013 RepID=A0A5C6ENA2_9BACT|nr:HAD-IIB family hydrolase [Rubripirellula reticaptiva]TWU49854.1 putative mannosyl-3-phosphoglycerate phosphatase [Rubripirellula reticaptiva]
MSSTTTRLILVTDLDGCLLNKHDYDWSAAASTLEILRKAKIPVVMNSSKTVPEMTQLAIELGLQGSTFISENGAVIRWGVDVAQWGTGEPVDESEIIGASRKDILLVLQELKQRFQFRSFADLGVAGIMEQTQLSEAKASLAFDRQATEPLLWDDTDEHLSEFGSILSRHQLTLTKGGRFWHIAGHTTKGKAMQRVAQRMSVPESTTIVAAVGDSPIDQSMLDLADVPIGIPTANGLGVTVDRKRGIVATRQGAVGWAEAVTKLLSRIEVPLTEN